MPKVSGTALLATAVVALSGALAACGSSESGSSDSTSTASASSASGEGGICITALVGVGLSPGIIEGFEEAGEAAGLSPTTRIANPQGDLNSALQNLRTCIQERPRIITATGLENSAAAAPIREASNAGIAYIANYAGRLVPGVTASISGDDAGQAAQLVEYTKENLAQDGAPLRILVLGASQLPPVRQRTDTFVELSRREGWDVTGPVELDLKDPAGSATQKVAAALASEDYDVIMSPWSDPTAGTIAAIRQARNTHVRVLDYDGDDNIFSQMRQGAPVAAVAGEPLGTMNELRRVIVRRILAGEIPRDRTLVVTCLGPTYTEANVPTKQQWEDNADGVCTVDGREITSAEVSRMAAAD